MSKFLSLSYSSRFPRRPKQTAVGPRAKHSHVSRFASSASGGSCQPEARGKGVCHQGQCDFLIAVAVKSFDSGDSNRDLHMLQAVRGAEFPLVTVRTRLPEDTPVYRNRPCRLGSSVFRANRRVQAGATPIGDGRREHPHRRNNSGHCLGLQDQPSISFSHARQE